MQIVIKDIVAPFGCRASYYNKACRFSNTIEQCGVEPIGIECLPNGRPGLRLALCSGEREYEILLDNSRAKLGLIRMHQPRVFLAQGGASSEATWQRFAQIVKQMEGK